MQGSETQTTHFRADRFSVYGAVEKGVIAAPIETVRKDKPHNSPFPANNTTVELTARSGKDMKATGIVRRVDDLGRIVIPKEIRRTLRIREGDPSLTSLTQWEKYCFSMLDLAKRQGW